MKKAKIGALAITAMMLMVVAPAVSAGTYEEARERYTDAVENFTNAYTVWINARGDFTQARWRWRHGQDSLATVVGAAQTATLKADDMMVRRVEVLRYRVQATRGLSDNEKQGIYAEIEAHVGWLQDEQSEIQSADNMSKIRSVASEIWNYWEDVRIEMRQISGQILSAWVDALVQRAETLAGIIEARINELENQGVDTTALESWLTDYNSKLELAKQKYNAAKEKFNAISGTSSVEDAHILYWEGVAYIREGNSYLKDALKALRDIVSEIVSQGHTITLSGSGTLVAQGDGSAYISGSGLVKITAIDNSVMTVSANANVKAEGGTVETLENGDVKYQGFTSARVTGSSITVNLSGSNVTLSAHGTGTVTLTGTGTYQTYGEDKYEDGTWEVAPTVTLATGEATAGVA